jgi:nicastrin
VSLFYRLGRLGCSTAEHETVQIGKLVYYNGAAPDANDPTNYVALVEDYNMITATIDILQADHVNTGRLQGILVLNSTSLKTGYTLYSPDTAYVQGDNTPSVQVNYGGAVQYKWNSRGQGLTNYDLHGIPIAYIMDSYVAQELRIEGQASSSSSSNNKATKNAIVAEFNYYMGPETMDSNTCLSWRDVSNQQWKPKCLPLGGLSVWAHVGSPPDGQNPKPIIFLTAGMDATNLYHDLSYGSNTAASNIIAMIMAAKLLGNALTDVQYDALPNRIVLALFQGETYGFIGSRRFLRDMAYPGFKCNSEVVRSNTQLGEKSDYGCLNPLRHNLRFMDLGNQIGSMLSIDQIGHAVANGILYVHGDADNSPIVNLLKNVGTNQFSVAASSAVDTGYGYPYPPSPYTSLLSLSEGAIPGAVLTGYDYDFPSKLPYHSQNDVPDYIELTTIAATATIMARTVLAAAYDDGTYSGQGDYATPTAYAKNLIPELLYNDAVLVEIANCFLRDGNCHLIQNYTKIESSNAGVNIGESLGVPPNYYVGTYHGGRGQPFVQVGDNIYGAYNGSDYGKKKTDVISLQPKQLEATIYGLFNDFLGRGSTSSSDTTTSCKKSSDCHNVENLCQNNVYDTATCAGSGICVCIRAQYHIAVDEALRSVEQMSPGYFVIDAETDAGISPIYTEPYWSSSVGVRIYRNANALPGYISLVAGIGIGAASFFGALVLKVGMKKEKLY